MVSSEMLAGPEVLFKLSNTFGPQRIILFALALIKKMRVSIWISRSSSEELDKRVLLKKTCSQFAVTLATTFFLSSDNRGGSIIIGIR